MEIGSIDDANLLILSRSLLTKCNVQSQSALHSMVELLRSAMGNHIDDELPYAADNKKLSDLLIASDDETKRMDMEKVMVLIQKLNQQRLENEIEDSIANEVEIQIVYTNSIQMTQPVKRLSVSLDSKELEVVDDIVLY